MADDTFRSNRVDEPEIVTSVQDSPVTNVAVSYLDQRRRRVTGRLVALSATDVSLANYLQNSDKPGNVSTVLVISFPSMPEYVELARQNEYRVASIYMAPDGIHQYLSTKPLEIPFSFSLSIHDREYCQHGALTLLATAAKLHAMVLPISTLDRSKRMLKVNLSGLDTRSKINDGQSDSTAPSLDVNATTPPESNSKDQKTDGTSEPKKEQMQDNTWRSAGGEATTYPPVAVLLDLISDGRDSDVSLGVSCVGYISNVKTRFKGPWLQPPNNGKNMPSMLECDFTFVHFPSYTNRFQLDTSSSQNMVNAYAEEIRANFYNLSEKSIGSNNSLDIGFGSDQASPYRSLSW